MHCINSCTSILLSDLKGHLVEVSISHIYLFSSWTILFQLSYLPLLQLDHSFSIVLVHGLYIIIYIVFVFFQVCLTKLKMQHKDNSHVCHAEYRLGLCFVTVLQTSVFSWYSIKLKL